MAGHFVVGALGLPDDSVEFTRKEVFASLVENQAAAGQIDVRPLAKLHAAFFQRFVDGLRDFLHFRFDNRGHFVAPDSAGGFILRRGNDIRFILIRA